MSDIFWATLPATIAAFGALLVAGAGVWVSLRTDKKVEQVHKATNSMKDALVAATRAEALQTGEAIGKAKEQEQPTTASVPIVDGGRRVTDQQ